MAGPGVQTLRNRAEPGGRGKEKTIIWAGHVPNVVWSRERSVCVHLNRCIHG